MTGTLSPDQVVGLEETVTLSLPEINSLCTRAARGAGFSWGLAEECGAAAVWLAEQGFDWAQIVFHRLSGPDAGPVHPMPNIWDCPSPACGLSAGVTLADFANLPEGLGASGISIGPVVNPLIMLAFVAQAARTTGRDCEVLLDNTPWVQLTQDGQVTRLQHGDADAVATVQIVPLTHQCKARQTTRSNTSILKTTYAQLDALALRMTVPATAQSQARAGGDGADDD